MVSPRKPRNPVFGQWCLGDAVLTPIHGGSCLGRPCVCLSGEGSRPQGRCVFTGFREWLFPNRINMEDGLGGCLVVWGAGRGCSQALRAPRRFAGNHLECILLDLRCPLSLGWGSRQWSAFGRELGMCVGPASRNLVIRTSESEHQEPLRQTYQHA